MTDQPELMPLPPMPETEDRQLWDDDRPAGYLESGLDWTRRNPEPLDWLIDNHVAIRSALYPPVTPSPTVEHAARVQALVDAAHGLLTATTSFDHDDLSPNAAKDYVNHMSRAEEKLRNALRALAGGRDHD